MLPIIIFFRQYCYHSRKVLPIYFKESYSYTINYRTFPKDAPASYGLSESKVFTKTFCNKKNCTGYKCFKCGKILKLNTFKCPKCDHLQIPNIKQSYFQLFDESLVYNVDEDKLKQKFRRLQSEYHPDKFATKGERERKLSEELSSFINKAYTTLNNPYERGVYLLKLNNIDMKENETQQLDKQFLMEVMELNEQLEEIKETTKLAAFESENDNRIKKISNDISKAFKSKQFNKAKLELQRMKYFVSLRNRIKDLKPRL